MHHDPCKFVWRINYPCTMSTKSGDLTEDGQPPLLLRSLIIYTLGERPRGFERPNKQTCMDLANNFRLFTYEFLLIIMHTIEGNHPYQWLSIFYMEAIEPVRETIRCFILRHTILRLGHQQRDPEIIGLLHTLMSLE